MADTAIADLPAASAALLTDEMPVNQGGVTKKVTLSQVAGIAGSPVVTHQITMVFDGAGSALAAGLLGYSGRISFSGTIQSWSITSTDVGATAGSIVIDVWKRNAFPPASGNSITGSAKPTLTSAQSAFSTSLPGWTTSVAIGDYLGASIVSASAVKQITLTLTLVGIS